MSHAWQGVLTEYDQFVYTPHDSPNVHRRSSAYTLAQLLEHAQFARCDVGTSIVIHSPAPLRLQPLGGRTRDNVMPTHVTVLGNGPTVRPAGNGSVRAWHATRRAQDGPMNRIVVLMDRMADVQHFNYGSLKPSIHALALCQVAAARLHMNLSSIECVPISTSNILTRGKQPEAHLSSEYAQFRSFQHLLFGRALSEPCTALTETPARAVIFGDAIDPYYNLPMSSPSMMKRVSPTSSNEVAACLSVDPARVGSILLGARCRSAMFGVWRPPLGTMEDIPFMPAVTLLLREMKRRLLRSVPHPTSTKESVLPHILLFQRSGCPLPARFGYKYSLAVWNQTAHTMHPNSRRCITNIEDIEAALLGASLNVTIVDFGWPQFADYRKVLQLVMTATMMIGVEGSGLLHHLWMPHSSAALVQLHPNRQLGKALDHFQTDFGMMFSEAWTHHMGVCVQDLIVGDLHSRPILPIHLVNVVQRLLLRLEAGTCRSCLLNSTTQKCRHVYANRKVHADVNFSDSFHIHTWD